MSDRIEALVARVQTAKDQASKDRLDMANRGDVRCWLKGINVGDEKMTVTVYGKLTEADRRDIIEFAAKMDARPVAK